MTVGMTRAALLAAALALAACTATPPPAPVAVAPSCGLANPTQLPVRMVDNAPLVLVLVAGQPVVLLLDTGADRTILTSKAAERIGLAPSGAPPLKGQAIGGQTDVFETAPTEVALSPAIRLTQRILLTDSAFADGVLGLDVLQRFDIDLHLAAGTVTLYPGGLCPGQSPPWTPPPWEIAAERIRLPGMPRVGPPYLMVPVVLDGTQTLAMLDTGALGITVVSPSLARHAGVADEALAADPPMRVLGFGTTSIMHVHRFRELRIGNERVEGLAAVVGGDDRRRFPVILGHDFLVSHRVWLNQAQGRVFVGRVGA